MLTQVLHDDAAPVDGAWYRTTVDAWALDTEADVTLIGPGGSLLASLTEERETLSLLSYHEADGEVGVRSESIDQARFDNLVSKKWTGRHLAPNAEEPVLTGGFIDLTSKGAATEIFQIADFNVYTSWTAFVVVKRVTGAFAGTAELLALTTSVGTDHRLSLLKTNSSGDVWCDAIVSSAAARGRRKNASLTNGETAIYAFSSKVGGQWRIYKNGVRVDDLDVGTGVGAAPSQFAGWANQMLVLGGHAGCPSLKRLLFYGGKNYADDEHWVLKMMTRLNSQYRVHE